MVVVEVSLDVELVIVDVVLIVVEVSVDVELVIVVVVIVVRLDCGLTHPTKSGTNSV